MTPQEIVSHVRKLPLHQQREIVQMLSHDLNDSEPSESYIAEQLLAQGVISEIPTAWNAPDDTDFQPVTIKGKPLSETIIEDRS